MHEKQYAAIHTLPPKDTSRLPRFVDNGGFIDDLKAHGLDTLFTDRTTFDTGEALRADLKDGNITFTPLTLSVDSLSSSIGAIRNHVLPDMTKKSAEAIPKLNSNELKAYSADKYTMYDDVLKDYQVPTELLPIDESAAARAEEIIESLDAARLVVKPNNGFRGSSIQKVDASELQETLAGLMESGKKGSLLVQPLVDFGTLPSAISGIGQREQDILKAVRSQDLLNELRVYSVKNGEDITFVPTLRVVEDKAGSMGDDDIYVDVAIEDAMYGELTGIAGTIIKRVSEKAGNIKHVLGAVDFFFDKDGQPFVMEANFRAPGLPHSDTNQTSARLLYPAIARTMYDMSKETH